MDGNNTNVMAPAGTVTLTDNATGKSFELPVIEGSIGPKVIDIRKLYNQSGYCTSGPGHLATAAYRRTIICINGDEGILLYHCCPIKRFADNKSYIEVSYVSLCG